jgi:transposase
MPIPKAKVVILSEVEKQGLEKLIKRHQTGQQVALRARIVLAAADRLKNKEIAEKYQVAADTVRLWRNRWVALTLVSAKSGRRNSRKIASGKSNLTN